MIEVVLLALAGIGIWFFKQYKEVMQAKKEIELKEIKNEAKETVSKKTAGDLLDDINKRYPSDSDGKG